MTDREEINDRFVTEMAERVAKVLQVSHGVMAARTPEEIKQELLLSLRALAAYPDSERTHSLISLSRVPGQASSFLVSLNLGNLTHFQPEGEA